MGYLDRAGSFFLVASPAAFTWLGLIVWIMVLEKQPVRRRCLARAGAIGALALIPLVHFEGLPKIDVNGLVRAATPVSRQGDLGLGSESVVEKEKETSRWFIRLSRVYAVGLTIQLAWLSLGHWGARKLAARASSPSGATLEIYQSLPFPGKRARPVLRVSERSTGPILLGVLRQSILIPAGLDRPETRDQLRLCLLHELAHAQSRDSLFVCLAGVSRAVWFFLPQAWWIRAQMRLDQEYLADDQASRKYGGFGVYAASLVGLADSAEFDRLAATRSVGNSSSVSPPSSSAGSALMRRVLMLVRCPFPVESKAPRLWRGTLAALTITGVLGASTLTLRPVPSRSIIALERHHKLLISRLTISDKLFTLPVEVAREYELQLEVYGDSESLAEVRICGRRLGRFAVWDDQADWHMVRVVRDGRGTFISLDGRAADEVPADGFSRSPRIMLQPPPGRSVKFRDILLTW